mgnify:CR=1 FL=1
MLCNFFYGFPKLDVKKFNITDDRKFARDLLHATNILIVPGSGFEWQEPDHFRLVMLPEAEELREAMKRIGEMIRVKPEGKQAYIDWHANPLPGVNEMIKECNIANYSIYSLGDYLFATYEYVGDDFEADMAKMAADPTTQKWWDIVKPLMEAKGYTLEIDEQTAPFVRMIFELYAYDRLGCETIAQRLNSLGARTSRGNLWNAGAVCQISTSPVYCGKVRWNDRISKPQIIDGEVVVKRVKNPNVIIADGKHPAIISDELFEAVRAVRASHDLVRNHVSDPVCNPLAGLVFCSHCGKSMIRRNNCGARGSKYDMLRCVTRGCPTTGCAISIVERSILDTLSSWLVEYADEPDHPRTDPRAEAIAAARANIQRLRAQRDRIFAAYEDGAYDAQTFVARRNAKDEEIAAADATLSALERDTTPSVEDFIRLQLPAIRTALDLYAIADDPRDKNRILKTVISRVDYQKDVHCYRNMNPADYLSLTITPAIP